MKENAKLWLVCFYAKMYLVNSLNNYKDVNIPAFIVEGYFSNATQTEATAQPEVHVASIAGTRDTLLLNKLKLIFSWGPSNLAGNINPSSSCNNPIVLLDPSSIGDISHTSDSQCGSVIDILSESLSETNALVVLKDAEWMITVVTVLVYIIYFCTLAK